MQLLKLDLSFLILDMSKQILFKFYIENKLFSKFKCNIFIFIYYLKLSNLLVYFG